MAKIGTAHVEVKPTLNTEALTEVCDQIETAIAAAVARGMTMPRGDGCTCPSVWMSVLPPPPCPVHGQMQTLKVTCSANTNAIATEVSSALTHQARRGGLA